MVMAHRALLWVGRRDGAASGRAPTELMAVGAAGRLGGHSARSGSWSVLARLHDGQDRLAAVAGATAKHQRDQTQRLVLVLVEVVDRDVMVAAWHPVHLEADPVTPGVPAGQSGHRDDVPEATGLVLHHAGGRGVGVGPGDAPVEHG